jgi:serine/threonine protein kinase
MTLPFTFAHYKIVSKIGEGGMGAVYRATDTKLNREVAVKILPGDFASSPDRLARFTREAQVLASLNHPHIAAIYGVEGRALIMELVEGSSPAGPLRAEEALPLIEQLIDALEYAHEKSAPHRKPNSQGVRALPSRRRADR